MKIELLTHASIKLTWKKKNIYFDPFSIDKEYHDADYIFITHDHYDHFDPTSIEKVSKESTKLIVPECLKDLNAFLVVEPNEEYRIGNELIIQTVPAYNTKNNYHKKEDKYVGYNVNIDGTWYYIMGDTDRTEESDQVKTDVCFVPIGGEFTMDAIEASDYINDLKPKKCIPIHYGKVAGSPNCDIEFVNRINKPIRAEIKMADLSFYDDEELKNRALMILPQMRLSNDEEEIKNYQERYKRIINEQARRKLAEKEENGGIKK